MGCVRLKELQIAVNSKHGATMSHAERSYKSSCRKSNIAQITSQKLATLRSENQKIQTKFKKQANMLPNGTNLRLID
jgi:hypothetical protein